MGQQILDDGMEVSVSAEVVQPAGVAMPATLYYWLLWILFPLGLLEYCTWRYSRLYWGSQWEDVQGLLMVLLCCTVLVMSMRIWKEKDRRLRVYFLWFGLSSLLHYGTHDIRLFDLLLYRLQFWETTLNWGFWWLALVPVRYFRLRTGIPIWKTLERGMGLYLLATGLLHLVAYGIMLLWGSTQFFSETLIDVLINIWLLGHVVLLMYEISSWRSYAVGERLLWGIGWLFWGVLLTTHVDYYPSPMLYWRHTSFHYIYEWCWGAVVLWTGLLGLYYGAQALKTSSA